jgi:hypothetical protein
VITIFPQETETLVLSHDWDEISNRVASALDKPFINDGIPKVIQGRVKDDTFQLSIRVRRQQFFMPLVRGLIEPTSKGCLVFLRYSLFPGMKVMLTFWTLFLPVISIPLVYQYKNYWIMGGFIIFAALMHVIAWANFRLHLQSTKAIVHQLLE